MDLIEQFAYPLPVIVICEMLGVPVADHERFKGWGLDIARGLDAIMLPPDSPVAERSVLARRALADYFRGLIAERRRAPRDDMLSGLIAAEEAGDKLSEDELLATCILLLVAGHETTVNLIGNGSLALLRHPDQLRRLREDPGLIVHRGGGAAALRRPGAAHRAHPERGRHHRRQDHRQGRDGDAVHRRRRPRSRPVPRPRSPRHQRAPRTATSPSAGASTSASARRSRAWRDRSPSTRSCGGCPSSRSPPTSREHRQSLTLRGLTSLPVSF